MSLAGQLHALASLPTRKSAVPVLQEVGWTPEPVWKIMEYLAPQGINLLTVQPLSSRYTA